jgi:pilus assembly protein FimV
MSVELKHSLVPLVLVVPTAGFAIGLGDIHVESALNEPLSARIEIVSATPDDLLDLRAAIANRELFQRYGADRPSFLASARFEVTQDSQGRPILRVTSSEPFTEPVVSLLVDVRWHKGELIREYPLLLDPADFALRTRKAEAAVASAAAPASEPVASATAPLETPPARARMARREASSSPAGGNSAASSGTSSAAVYRVGSRDTLRGVARRVAKSRHESVLQRTMIAIFRANPSAFDGNINRLHGGALLTIPSGEALAAVSAGEARIEVRAQMSAWHHKAFFGAPQPALASARTSAPRPAPAPEPASAGPSVAQDDRRNAAAGARSTPAIAATARAAPADASSDDSLERRIQSLEQALKDTKRILSSEHATLQSLQQYVAETASVYPVAPAKSSATREGPADATEAPEHRLSRGTIWGLIGGAVALVLLTAWKWRVKRSHMPPRFPPVAHEQSLATVLADSPFAAEFKERASPAAAAQQSSAPTATRSPTSTPSPTSAPSPTSTPGPTSAPGPTSTPSPTASASSIGTSPETQAVPVDAPSLAVTAAVDGGDTTISLIIDGAVGEHTVNLAAPTQQIPVNTERLTALTELERELEASYDPTATDVFEHVPIAEAAARKASATAQHVQMPSKLSERPVVAQERTNIIEVLRKAIQADPHRLDLRLKLLELYFNSDMSGREEFVEVARKLARTGEILTASDWDKVAALGARADSAAVTQEQKLPGKLADCA